MLVKDSQRSKVLSAMPTTELGILMLDKDSQRSKALTPIVVTVLAIMTVVKFSHSEKAFSPITVTGKPSIVSGMTSSPEAEILQSVIVMVSPLTV